ncbi:MAG TPA: DUF3017 domain-containing protein [Jatrophihabitans sp.]|nr:DUF3017 domain-containing protein [Jatrophihabitans sp.]
MLGRVGRWIGEQFAFLVVLAVLAAAFGYLTVDPSHWARVAGLVAVALLLAGGARLTLPTERVGLLVVRGRIADTICFLGLGVVILAVDIRLHG